MVSIEKERLTPLLVMDQGDRIPSVRIPRVKELPFERTGNSNRTDPYPKGRGQGYASICAKASSFSRKRGAWLFLKAPGLRKLRN